MCSVPFSMVFRLYVLPESSKRRCNCRLLALRGSSFLRTLLNVFIGIPSFYRCLRAEGMVFSFISFSRSLLPRMWGIRHLRLSVRIYFLFLVPWFCREVVPTADDGARRPVMEGVKTFVSYVLLALHVASVTPVVTVTPTGEGRLLLVVTRCIYRTTVPSIHD